MLADAFYCIYFSSCHTREFGYCCSDKISACFVGPDYSAQEQARFFCRDRYCCIASSEYLIDQIINLFGRCSPESLKLLIGYVCIAPHVHFLRLTVKEVEQEIGSMLVYDA